MKGGVSTILFYNWQLSTFLDVLSLVHFYSIFEQQKTHTSFSLLKINETPKFLAVRVRYSALHITLHPSPKLMLGAMHKEVRSVQLDHFEVANFMESSAL